MSLTSFLVIYVNSSSDGKKTKMLRPRPKPLKQQQDCRWTYSRRLVPFGLC